MLFLLALLACGSDKIDLEYYRYEFTCDEVRENDGWITGENPVLDEPPVFIQTNYEGHYEDGTIIYYGYFPSYAFKVNEDGTWEFLTSCSSIYVPADTRTAYVDVIHVVMGVERHTE